MSDPKPGFPVHGFDSPHKITDSIQIIASLEPDTHIISYGPQDVSTRIIAAIIYSIFAGVFSGVPLYFGINGWSKLFERPFEEAAMVVAGALLIGIGLPIEIAPLRSSTSEIINLASIAAYSSEVIEYKN